ncbi:MAG: HAD family hydrolase [Blautia sp.]|nr:HAD family hydrolase [Blautia sp.]MCM1201812.1 HAD family hydrolase [Bacteroides fragilis]
MITTIIFDLDGTLLDTLEDLTDSVNDALGKSGFPERTIDEIRSFVGNGIASLIARVLPEGKENPHYDEVLKTFREYYALHCKDKTRPYDGILPMLDALREQGYRMAVVSNKFDAAVKELCALYFGDRIEAAVGESEKVRKKPAPDAVYQVLEELSAKAEDAVYVGDSDVDLATAANVPMTCISVTWGFRSRGQLLAAGAKEGLMVTDPKRLPALLRALSQEG